MSQSLDVKLYNADSLDLEKFCIHQRTSFQDLLLKNGVNANFMTAEFFQWKYHTPAGNALVAVVENNNGEIAASTSLTPVQVFFKGSLFTAWQVTDAATAPGFRGRGLFEKNMNCLRGVLSGEDVQFGFPNRESKKQNLKNGHIVLGQIGFYIKPFFLKNKQFFFKAGEAFESGQTVFFENLSMHNHPAIFRSYTYMNWRYVTNPRGGYFIHSVIRNAFVVGLVVLKRTTIKSTQLLLLMEYHFLSEDARSEINDFISFIAYQEKCTFIGFFSSKGDRSVFKLPSMVQVPAFLLPKKQVLTVASNNLQHPLLKNEWHIQTGDWDAF